MIIITKPEKPLLLTDKGTTKRQPNLVAYADEIKATYMAFELSSCQDIPLPKVWDVPNATTFVRGVVEKVMGKHVSDTNDIFQYGADR